MSHEVLAFDLGASGGRVVAGRLDGEQLTAIPLHRFPNDPVRLHRHLYWDILRLFHEMKQGLRCAQQQGFRRLQSMGIDTWGLDFGLLGANGELLGMPLSLSRRADFPYFGGSCTDYLPIRCICANRYSADACQYTLSPVRAQKIWQSPL